MKTHGNVREFHSAWRIVTLQLAALAKPLFTINSNSSCKLQNFNNGYVFFSEIFRIYLRENLPLVRKLLHFLQVLLGYYVKAVRLRMLYLLIQ